jgi:hypothetical protein
MRLGAGFLTPGLASTGGGAASQTASPGSSEGPLSADALVVSDGVSTWTQDGVRKEHRQSTQLPHEAIFSSVPFLGTFGYIKRPSNSIRLHGSEKILAAGTERDCWVVVLTRPSPFPLRSTWYIGKAGRQLWRMHGEADMGELSVKVFMEVQSIETDAVPSRE